MLNSTSSKGKRWIGFDWDGTVTTYSTWDKQGTAFGDPIKPMVARIQLILAAGVYDVKVFTARACEANTTRDEDLAEIRRLCVEWFGKELPITNQKDFACAAIYDDVAIPVIRNTGMIPLPADHPYWAFVPEDPFQAFADDVFAMERALADTDQVIAAGLEADAFYAAKKAKKAKGCA